MKTEEKKNAAHLKKLLPVFLGALAGVFAILTSLFVARPLGSALYGKIQYYLSVVNTVSLFISFGLPFFLIKTTQKADDSKANFTKCLLLFDIVSGCFFPVYFLIAFFLLPSLGKDLSLILLIYLASFFLSLSSIVASFFLGEKKLSLYQLVFSFLPKAILFAVAFVLVRFVSSELFVRWYIPVFFIAYGCSSIPFVFSAIKKTKIHFSSQEFGTLIIFLLSSLASTVSSYLAKIIQGDFYSNYTILGIFSLSMQILTAGVLFCSVISNLSQPYFASLSNSGSQANIEYFRHILRWNSNIAIPFCFALIFEAKTVLGVFGGDSYSLYPQIMSISAIAVLIEVMVGPINVFFSMGGHEKVLLWNGVLKIITLTLFCWVFSYFSDYGVPLAYLCSALLVSVAGLIEIHRIYKIPPIDWKTLLYLVGESIFSSGIFVALSFVQNTRWWLVLNVFCGLLTILLFFSVSPFAIDQESLPIVSGTKKALHRFLSGVGSCTQSVSAPFKKWFNRIYSLTFYLLVADIILMGDDKMFFYFTISSVAISPRMIFSAVLLIEFLVSFFVNANFSFFKKRSFAVFVTMIILALFSFGLGVLVNGGSAAFTDAKTFLYLFLVFPFFDLVSLHLVQKERFLKFVVFLSTVLAIFLLAFHFYLQARDISVFEINDYFVSKFRYSTGFGFREGYGVYYDGLLYCTISGIICLYFSLFQKQKTSYQLFLFLMCLVNYAAVFQSQTRGFEFTLLIFSAFFLIWKYFVYFRDCKNSKQRIITNKFLFLSLFLVLALGSSVYLVITRNLLDRLLHGDTSSDNVRFAYLQEVIPELFKMPFLFGKFLGYKIESANIWHIETSLLEIFLKQGFLGFIAWCCPLFVAIVSNTRRTDPLCYKVCLIILIFLYFTSFFNPYLFSVNGICILICCSSFLSLESISDLPYLLCVRSTKL